MRSLSLIALAALVALILTATSSATRVRPSLSLHGRAPLTVRGSHFHRREHVKITSSSGASVSVRATSHGTFTTSLRAVPVDRCSGLIVRALGSAGSVAVIKRPPLPACLPMRTSGISF